MPDVQRKGNKWEGEMKQCHAVWRVNDFPMLENCERYGKGQDRLK